ncbi:hypothetical protein BAUCODRAFT_570024 [Baudoinia panamericana UAMH 10762]|uniref:Uncharacterized protein n=1 Tax=Baudoinia panamericana (strain UAMH 10762) TaxID=717646 RepID=M2MME2_BAUPA|nr:uncharacterized protein BAUCODRAFT_570024 [Baudoinia panamericana UAMH 10762]EMC92538.1 hypothetical protein BAUCODRAFT_570024 [Baudoinia panamericana UAMH 10762]
MVATTRSKADGKAATANRHPARRAQANGRSKDLVLLKAGRKRPSSNKSAPATKIKRKKKASRTHHSGRSNTKTVELVRGSGAADTLMTTNVSDEVADESNINGSSHSEPQKRLARGILVHTKGASKVHKQSKAIGKSRKVSWKPDVYSPVSRIPENKKQLVRLLEQMWWEKQLSDARHSDRVARGRTG